MCGCAPVVLKRPSCPSAPCTLVRCASHLRSPPHPPPASRAHLLPRRPAEAATWSGRCEGLRGSLAAKEAHAAALEAELGSRPTQLQVDELRQQVRAVLLFQPGRACCNNTERCAGQSRRSGRGGAAAAGARALCLPCRCKWNVVRGASGGQSGLRHVGFAARACSDSLWALCTRPLSRAIQVSCGQSLPCLQPALATKQPRLFFCPCSSGFPLHCSCASCRQSAAMGRTKTNRPPRQQQTAPVPAAWRRQAGSGWRLRSWPRPGGWSIR